MTKETKRENEHLKFIVPVGESELARDAREAYTKSYRGIGIAELGANFVRNVLLTDNIPGMRDFVCAVLGIDPKADKETIEKALHDGKEWLYNLTGDAVAEDKNVWEMECQNDKEDAEND